jgi:hypothetical protein
MRDLVPARRRLTPVGMVAAAVIALVAACGGGSTTSAPAATSTATQAAAATATQAAATQGAASTNPFAVVDQFEGTYSGTWTNTTFGSTGPASVQVRVRHAESAVEITLTLGGNVFGQPSPAPETLSATITAGQPLSFTSKTFGPTTVTFDAATMKLTFTSNDVPSARVKTFVATATITDPKTIDLAYDVTFRDATPAAKGMAKLTR